jgi:hypothetical protein
MLLCHYVDEINVKHVKHPLSTLLLHKSTHFPKTSCVWDGRGSAVLNQVCLLCKQKINVFT